MSMLKTVRELWTIAWPVILSGLVTLLISGNDAVLLVGSSDRTLSSVVAASSVQTVAAMMVAGLVSSAQVLIARASGAGRRDHAARSADAALWLGVWGGVAGMLLLLLAGPLVLGVVAGAAVDGELAARYLGVTVTALPFAGLLAAMRARLAGLGRTRGLFIASAAAAVTDIGGSLLLNALIGPFGVALGTVAASIVGAAVVTFAGTRAGRSPNGSLALRAPNWRGLLRRPGAALRPVLALGWPEAVLFGANAGAGFVVVWLLSSAAPSQLAASRFLDLATSTIVYTVLAGFGTAAATLLGRAAGAQHLRRFAEVGRHAFVTTGSVAVIALLSGPWLLLGVLELAASDSVVAAAEPVVWIAFAQSPLMAVYVVLTASLRALKDTRSPMFASLISEYVVFLPLGLVLTRLVDWALLGVFLAHLAFWCAATAICVLRLRGRLRELRGTDAAAVQPGTGGPRDGDVGEPRMVNAG